MSVDAGYAAARSEAAVMIRHDAARLKREATKAMLAGDDELAERFERGEARPFELISVSDLLKPQSSVPFVIDGIIEAGCTVGLVAPPEHGKSLLAQHWAACVGAGRDFHEWRTKHGLAVYLFGEGQQGAARRFQALDRFYSMELDKAAIVVSRCATSLLDPLEVARVRAAISEAEAKFGLPLTLLVVDTVARFLAPGDESKAADMGAYMAAVDTLRGDATAVSCHHPGHGDVTRGRGSSSWKAALDAEYTIASEGGVFTLTCQKMKDGEKPAPFSFRLETVSTLCAREDGTPINSVVLVPTEAAIVRPKITGKAQKQLLAELERRIETGDKGLWNEAELREIGRSLGMSKTTAKDAGLGLKRHGCLVSDGLSCMRLATLPEDGTKGRNWEESMFSSRTSRDERDGGYINTPVSSRVSTPPGDGVVL